MNTKSQSIDQAKFNNTERKFNDLHVDSFTNAPERAMATIKVNANPEKVFAKLADHKNMNKWVPMIKHEVQVDHSKSETPNQNDIGTVRVCNFGGDLLTEKIVYWRNNQVYAYSVTPGESSPAVDHLGVIMVEQTESNGSLVTWKQFFNPKPGSMKAKMMPFMMQFVMKKALKNLAKQIER